MNWTPDRSRTGVLVLVAAIGGLWFLDRKQTAREDERLAVGRSDESLVGEWSGLTLRRERKGSDWQRKRPSYEELAALTRPEMDPMKRAALVEVPVRCVVEHLERMYPGSYESIAWGEVYDANNGSFQVRHRFRHALSPKEGIARWINYDSTGAVTGIYAHVARIVSINGKPFDYDKHRQRRPLTPRQRERLGLD